MRKMPERYTARYFTLIELLIVIAVIGILVSIAAPALSKARATGVKTQCANNLRQSALALIMYGDTNGGWVTIYGPSYTGWYIQPGLPEKLGFTPSASGSRPADYRPVTLCPAGVDDGIIWKDNVAYGTPYFALFPEDYASYKCEMVINGTEEYLRISAIPAISNYVLLADTAYTRFDSRPQVLTGAQCLHFARRDEGAASPIAYAICERHLGTANLAYADAHVDDSADKASLLNNSLIGAYIDISGEDLTYLDLN